MLNSAVRFVAAKGAKQSPSIQLLCHVKPGVNAKREGVAAVSDDGIELCVSAKAKDGEANKAVREVISEVLGVPKSDVEIAKGMRSREKTVVIHNLKASKTPEEEVERIKIILGNVAR